ncbi:MAG: hypothetical protein M1828_005625 [Chrysothrix sp. TS-e1954]|nr:MAG: hypothetical protein M1828_005625 [Chrysothrix sp. TS-e1954]
MAAAEVSPQRTSSPSQSAFSTTSSATTQKNAEPTVPEEYLTQIGDLPVYDAQKQPHKFAELYDRPGRSLIIFIRHAFCGMCHDFIRELNDIVTPDELKESKTPTSIDIIFCGEPHMIPDYISLTNLRFPLYTDPGDRKLYEALNMTSTFAAGSKPGYVRGSMASVTMKSLVQVLSSGSDMLKGGSFSQVGGEFLFEDGKNVWLHRMRNTRDHTEPSELKRMLRLTG